MNEWAQAYAIAEARYWGTPLAQQSTTITIEPATLQYLLRIAHRRNDHKAPAQSRKASDVFNDLEVDFIGVKGEYVVSQIYGTPFDDNGYGANGDDGIDIRTPRSGSIKTNHRVDGYLLVERWRDVDKAELIHLVDGPCRPPQSCVCHDLTGTAAQRWRYVGWITTEDFKTCSTLANWGLGPRRYCRAHQLTHGRHP